MSTEGIGVLIGLDESVCSQEALAWAAADATARQVPLTIASVVELPVLADVRLPAHLLDAAQQAARQRVDAAVFRARDMVPGAIVEGRVLTGNPVAELLLVAGGANQVVVGSHGASGFGALLVGSVGSQVAEHASCPAVVVRGSAHAGPVVVGVDTSERGQAALEYGFAYADRHGRPLVALHVLTPGSFAYPVTPYPIPEDVAMIRTEAARTIEQSVRTCTEKYPDVPIRTDIVEGRTAQELVEASRTAALLVVGTRGHGGLAGMLLGSVSHAVLRHAHCPVVIAR